MIRIRRSDIVIAQEVMRTVTTLDVSLLSASRLRLLMSLVENHLLLEEAGRERETLASTLADLGEGILGRNFCALTQADVSPLEILLENDQFQDALLKVSRFDCDRSLDLIVSLRKLSEMADDFFTGGVSKLGGT